MGAQTCHPELLGRRGGENANHPNVGWERKQQPGSLREKTLLSWLIIPVISNLIIILKYLGNIGLNQTIGLQRYFMHVFIYLA